jgi:hypothetical protein
MDTATIHMTINGKTYAANVLLDHENKDENIRSLRCLAESAARRLERCYYPERFDEEGYRLEAK